MFQQARPYDISFFDAAQALGNAQKLQGMQQQNALSALELRTNQQALAEAERARAAQQQLLAGIQNPDRRLAATIAPKEYVKSILPDPDKRWVDVEGIGLVDVFGGTPRVAIPVPGPSWGAPGGGAGQNALAAVTVPGAPPATTTTPPGGARPYAAAVTGRENNSGNPAARNRNSSAVGDGQFIDATWLDLVKRNRPDLTQGRSDAEILKLREDPELSAQMIDTFALENRDYLTGAGVQNVGAGELYAAHFFGPEGAAKVLQASPDTPLSAILSPGAIQANPQLRGLTAGQALARFREQFAGVQAPGQPAPAGVAASAAAPAGGNYEIRYDKNGLPTPYPGRTGYVVARTPDGKIVGVPAPNEGLSAEDQERQRKAAADEEKARSDAGARTFDQERQLRDDHAKAIKGFDVAQQNFFALPALAADETGGSDIALVNAFYKTFAPDSTVLEGEFATAARAKGMADNLVGLIAKAQSGQFLTPTQRQELIQAAGRFFEQRTREVEAANGRFRTLAGSYPGVNVDRVVLNPIRDRPTPQADPSKWERVTLPPEVTPAGKYPTARVPSGGPGVPPPPPGFTVIGG